MSNNNNENSYHWEMENDYVITQHWIIVMEHYIEAELFTKTNIHEYTSEVKAHQCLAFIVNSIALSNKN